MSEPLVIRISGNIKNFDDALNEAQEKTEALEGKLSEIAKVSAVAFAALTAEVVLSVKAFGEAEAIDKKLTLAMQNQGIFSRELKKAYDEQAKALQKLTGLDDDAIKDTIAYTQGMIGQDEVTQNLTTAILDLAAGKDIDAKSSAELISKGINGQTAALKKLGIEVDANLSRQERTAEIIAQVTQRFGGQAAEANKGVGSIRGLTAAFGNFQEEIGARFAPLIEKAVKSLTGFFEEAAKSDKLLDLIAALIGGGAAISGFISAVSTMGIVLTTAKAIVTAFGVSLATALGPLTLVAIAVGALGAALGYQAVNMGKTADEVKRLEGFVNNMRNAVTRYQSIVDNPTGRAFVDDKAIANLEAARVKLAAFEAELKNMRETEANSPVNKQIEEKKKLAEQIAANEREAEAARLASLRAQNELIMLEASGASQAYIALKKQEAELLAQIEDEKFKKVRQELLSHLDEIQLLESDQFIQDAETRTVFNDQILAQNEEFQLLSEEQKRIFMLKNAAALQGEILTEETARQKSAADKARAQIKSDNDFLINRQKFGQTFAELNRFLHSAEMNESMSHLQRMAAMQTSQYSVLKAIGKAAAITHISISTARAAMSAFEWAEATFPPPAGQIIGYAAAAATVAFGAEQVGRVVAAADGGLMTGGIPGMDSIPTLTMPGEIVVPTRNYEEVVTAVADKRNSERSSLPQEAMDGGGSAMVEFRFIGEMAAYVEAKIIERQRLGISLLPEFT